MEKDMNSSQFEAIFLFLVNVVLIGLYICMIISNRRLRKRLSKGKPLKEQDK